MAKEIQVKGAAFKEDFEYITKKQGQDGLKLLEKRLRKMGHPYPLTRVEDMQVYPIEYRVDFLKALKDEFGWSDKQVFNMARKAPRVNSAMKFFVRYLVSLEMAFRSAGKYWDNYFTAGRLEPLDFDKQKKHVKLVLHDFPVDDILYNQLSGYFCGVMDLTGIQGARCARIEKLRKDRTEILFHMEYDL